MLQGIRGSSGMIGKDGPQGDPVSLPIIIRIFCELSQPQGANGLDGRVGPQGPRGKKV